jgi:hypothetical protein
MSLFSICLSVPQQPWSKICGLYFTKRTACVLYMPLLDPFLSITKTFNKISLFSMIVGVSTWNQPFEPRSRGASWAIRQDARLSSVGGRLIGGFSRGSMKIIPAKMGICNMSTSCWIMGLSINEAGMKYRNHGQSDIILRWSSSCPTRDYYPV